MRMTVFIEPQFGATYDDQLRIARRAQECGYDAFFRSDHYLTMRADGGLPGPTDAWVTLAGLARETSGIRLGTMVTSATFRLPGPLAISAAQVDQMSGGRVELGLGAGWFLAEHEAYGIPFPPLGERFDRLTEQLEIITGMWATPVGETFAYDGRHYQVTGSPALPKPAQRPAPTIIVGGTGARRTPALAARFADEFNVPFRTLAETTEVFGRVEAAVEAAGRATPLVFSAAQTIICGRTDAEVRRRAEAAQVDVDDVRERGLYGTPAEIVDRLGEFARAGAQRVHLQFLDLDDPDHLDLVAAEVVTQLD
ncbi:LLM class F420-dependent oxidoreductase [Luedemannella helvata]|uniref:LLM class F420-dependent oxidoreductase n=1 Tax=Luedemannella helvata TaxID=349315 RepID=A0ABN2KM21_9ACTN